MIRLILKTRANHGGGEVEGFGTFDLYNEELESRLGGGYNYDGTFSTTDIIGSEIIRIEVPESQEETKAC